VCEQGAQVFNPPLECLDASPEPREGILEIVRPARDSVEAPGHLLQILTCLRHGLFGAARVCRRRFARRHRRAAEGKQEQSRERGARADRGVPPNQSQYVG
jgi:hypothetical protein